MVKCNKCKKENAIVRITTIRDGQRVDLLLCALCAKQEKSLAMGEMFQDPDAGVNALDQIQKELEEGLKGSLQNIDKKLLESAIKDIQDAVSSLALSPADVEALMPSKACPKCGITWEEIKKTSKLGCPYDYEFFEEDFAPTMKRLHLGGTKHVGKVPANIHLSVSQQVEALEQELAASIKREDYEKAAELRDKIKALKAQD